ncbi:MAG: hypothetical protein KAI83_02665 [Thiomargarita sp.]|nr:hypothetical protein [Thiomargarita sp.]
MQRHHFFNEEGGQEKDFAHPTSLHHYITTSLMLQYLGNSDLNNTYN